MDRMPRRLSLRAPERSVSPRMNGRLALPAPYERSSQIARRTSTDNFMREWREPVMSCPIG